MTPLTLVSIILAWLPAATLPHNEETTAVGALMQIGTHRHLQSLMANMSADKALTDPPQMPAELQAFVSLHLGAKPTERDAQAFLQAHTSKSTMLTKVASESHLKLGTMGADQAKVVLNKMAMDTMKKLDMQRAACIGQHDKQQQLMDETGQDVNSFNAQGTNARANVMAAQSAIKRLEEMIPRLNHELAMHDSKCKDSIASLKEQITLIQADTATLTQVSSASGCMAFLQIGLVKCTEHSNQDDRRKSFITFKHPVMRHKANKLKTPVARNSLQKALEQALLQTESHRHHRRGSGRQHHHRKHEKRRRVRVVRHKNPHAAHSTAFIVGNMTRKLAVNGTEWPSTNVQKCTLSPTIGCNQVKDKLILMQANVLDEVDGRRAELASAEDDCRQAKKNLQYQIRSAAMKLQEQQEMLAETTTVMIDAAEESRLKNKQLDHLESERKKMVSFCQDTVNNAALELCKIKSIRQELYKIGSQRPFIQDCEVSTWTPMGCSKTCDGGVQNLVRQVIVPASGGAACPPLSMQSSCNTQKCPVDCGIGDWSGWTSCSAKCGGGIMQRIRHVKTRPQHGGKLCGPEADSRECGTQACDQDCQLSIWTEWSSCSKGCGGGFATSRRTVLSSALGLGRCPAEDSASRERYKRCNLETCVPKTGTTMKCNSTVDVIFLLDSSGSTGQTGWNYVRTAGSTLVSAMDPTSNGGNGAQVAVLMYSGPASMDNYKKCTGEVTSPPVDLATDCNIVWVKHYTTDTATTASTVGALNWRQGSTMASQALATAESEIILGRVGVPAVVVVISDQLPMMPRKTAQVAESMRKKAKLVWAVAAGSTDLQKIATFASKPVADNVVHMNSLKELQEPHVLNKIITSVCPSVV